MATDVESDRPVATCDLRVRQIEFLQAPAPPGIVGKRVRGDLDREDDTFLELVPETGPFTWLVRNEKRPAKDPLTDRTSPVSQGGISARFASVCRRYPPSISLISRTIALNRGTAIPCRAATASTGE